MTRYIHSPNLKARLVARVLARWQACSDTVQDGGWIGHTFLDDVPQVARSYAKGFLPEGYVQDKVYVPPMPTTLQVLQEHITAVVTETCYRTSGRNWITVGMCARRSRAHTLNISSMYQKLGECMYLFTYHRSLYVIYL
ncbi:hypothetical protein AVEN_188396-1 [Araneus ventricosus]|uniref:Uncharacterized protein n=1 Tax=Araneus ventricosus TaxID=182803 RepID=A0A4Y2E9H9_ARAVE|nr:hypothetical protein AVEN_188396-1 [Araneus ventricosus]